MASDQTRGRGQIKDRRRTEDNNTKTNIIFDVPDITEYKSSTIAVVVLNFLKKNKHLTLRSH